MSNDMKWIERKSIAPIEPATGAVSDTLNVEDKVKNAPSINLVTQMTGIPQDGIIIYEGDEIPEGYEEINEGIDDTPTGAIIDWEDGVEIPEGWEETEGKSIVQVGYNGSTAFTVTTTNTKTFVPMAKQLSKIGNGFTVQSDGTVLVNKTMKIRAKAQVMLTASGTGAKILMIDINQYDWSYDRVVSLKDYVPLKSDTYILDVKQGDILRLYYQGDANDTFHTSTAFVYMYIEEINDPNKPIKKVAVTEVPKIEGSIVDGTNIDDKTTNTYSANVIDKFNTYSTEEKFTGMYWIDGKPIYRKKLSGTLSAVGTYTELLIHNDLDEITRSYQYYLTSQNQHVPIPFVNSSLKRVTGNSLGCNWVFINEVENNVGLVCNVIVEYTKTTD